MKKSLSVAMVVAMVSSMFASMAFADDAATTTAPLTAEQKYEALVKAGVLEGDDTGANLTGLTNRAQIAKILAKAFGLTEDASAAASYTDITDASVTWASGFIGAVTKAKLMEGPADGKFAPSSNVTMQELATVLVRAFGLDAKASTDVGGATVSDWAKGYVAAALKAGLVSNKTDFTAAAQRSDLVYSAYVAEQGKDVVALTADKWEVVDSKNVKVTFSDKVTQTFPLATALEAGKATNVTVVYKDKEFTGSVTLPVVTAKVTGVTALTNNKIKLSFDVKATSFDKSSVTVKAKADGAALEVKDATLASDGMSAVVATAAQTAYAAYTATVADGSFNFVGLPVDTTKPSISGTVAVDGKGLLTIVFNEDVDSATATNPANYTFDNNLTASSVTMSDSKTVKVTTSAQTNGQLYQLTVANVSDLAGNVMDSKSGLYFSGVVDTTKPTVSSVNVNGDGTVDVLYSESLKKDTAEAVQNYTFDNNLQATAAKYTEDTSASPNVFKVTLTTSAQTNGQLYKLTVKNVADVTGNVIDSVDKYFSGVVDTTKPSVTSVTPTDSTIKVVFNEALNKDQATNVANYTIDNNLQVTGVSVSDDLKTVTLKTAAQTNGQLYKLTIKGIADKAGNTMDSVDKYFSGVQDTSGPSISSVTTNPAVNNTVVIQFNEDLNKSLAQDPSNYVIDGGIGYPTKAVYDNSTAGVYKVTLTTAAQTAGTVYNVTVNNLKDLVGNTIAANTKKSFSGVNTNATVYTLQTIQAVDVNTLDVYFDSELSDSEASSVALTVYGGSSATGTPMTTSVVSQVKRSDNKKVIRFYLNNAAANGYANGYFVQGQVYTAVVSGVAKFPSDVTKNTKSFGGTSATQSVPVALAAAPINSTSAKITFDRMVKNVQASNFTIVDAADSTKTINVTGVQDSTAGVLDNVTTATLNFDTATKLVGGHTYKVTFNAGIVDPAGQALKTTNSDSSAYSIQLGGVDLANTAPKMIATQVKDKYNFDIIFSEPVKNAATANYTIVDTSANNAAVSVANAVYTASSDLTRVTVSLNKDAAALVGGHAYTVTYNLAGSIVDKQDLAYDTTTNANVVNLGGADTANDQPVVVAVDATSSDKKVKLTFNEDLYKTPAVKYATTDTVSATYFTVTIDGATIAVSSVAVVDSKTLTLTLNGADANIAKFAAAKTGSVTISSTGAANLLDINGQTAKTDAVTFGTR